ncbi:hypothetical protein Arnit_0431 [Arcobacter nitrofigilis DSM 7299]|uniref:Uncharacterized protein n=1 Tax=Arcobacter nitrofigilis (strain ATCC 33309 / DSM 7299 / CCUG 15893 / LMG 7604 / NCTC 12251 / CI) TaxID=572480 RepID=D5V5R0_ARCNC|nr:hypothetical protein [Arcobacter nitrofigilis]ADG92096.1 hypothetical protein Arnit_0431 [Arcobacter nitrofigilis DSM 7299]
MKILFNSIIIILGFIILFNEIFIPDNLFYSYKLLGIPFIGFGFINLKKELKD